MAAVKSLKAAKLLSSELPHNTLRILQYKQVTGITAGYCKSQCLYNMSSLIPKPYNYINAITAAWQLHSVEYYNMHVYCVNHYVSVGFGDYAFTLVLGSQCIYRCQLCADFEVEDSANYESEIGSEYCGMIAIVTDPAHTIKLNSALQGFLEQLQ